MEHATPSEDVVTEQSTRCHDSNIKRSTTSEHMNTEHVTTVEDAHMEHPTRREDPDREHPAPAEGTRCVLLMHSPAELRRGWRTKRRHLFLFSDLLLVSNTKYNKTFKIKHKIPLNTICMDQGGKANKGARRSFVLSGSTVNFVATFSSSELMEKWLSLLQRYIDIAKKKDKLKSLHLKILTEDIKNCAPGSERDLLWVSSGKNEVPYPLIDPNQKRWNIKSPITSPFRRGPLTSQDNQVRSPPKQLFGVSLSDLCEDDNLPGPLLDILSYIKKRGPLTEGIFRKSADRDSCRALKDKLNSGDKVDLNNESVLTAASVLKDFLQNIPGSIFSQGLYDKWLHVLDEGNAEQKIAASQRLLEQLPRANAVLLRHLFRLLHGVHQHSFTNQMTAHNLGVRLTPSVFCLPIARDSDLRTDLRRKFDVAQFLIENALEIFGEDITSRCAESPTREPSKKAARAVKDAVCIGQKQTPGLPGAGGDVSSDNKTSVESRPTNVLALRARAGL